MVMTAHRCNLLLPVALLRWARDPLPIALLRRARDHLRLLQRRGHSRPQVLPDGGIRERVADGRSDGGVAQELLCRVELHPATASPSPTRRGVCHQYPQQVAWRRAGVGQRMRAQ